MTQNCVATFIDKHSIDTRTTLFNITEHTGTIPHFDGFIQDETLKCQFLKYLRYVYAQFTESISVINDTNSRKGIVRVSCADIYKEASFSSGIVTQALLGTIVQIIAEKNDWSYVQLPDRYLGWVNETIENADSKKIGLWSSSENLLIVNVPYAIVFNDESCTGYVSDVSMGNVLFNHGTNGTFYKVEFPDSRNGFISVDAAVLFKEWKETRLFTSENIVATAKQLMGIPYVWGGCSSRGLDCSGFTKLTYMMNGYMLPRDADQQATIGSNVDFDFSYSSLKPGDLLFFGRRRDGTVDKRDGSPVPISHVGLSLGGSIYMQASGNVHRSSLDQSSCIFDKRRSESLQMVKRIIK